MCQVLDKGIMCYSSCLWDSTHPLSYKYKDVSIVYLVIEIVFIYELKWGHGYLYHYIFCSIHTVIKVKKIDVHTHVPQFDVGDGAVDM